MDAWPQLSTKQWLRYWPVVVGRTNSVREESSDRWLDGRRGGGGGAGSEDLPSVSHARRRPRESHSLDQDHRGEDGSAREFGSRKPEDEVPTVRGAEDSFGRQGVCQPNWMAVAPPRRQRDRSGRGSEPRNQLPCMTRSSAGMTTTLRGVCRRARARTVVCQLEIHGSQWQER